MKFNINKRIVLGTTYSFWCALGFIRGLNHYDYNYKNYNKENSYLYSSKFAVGLFGVICYANPILMPLFICKEIYRGEVNIRNIEDEKKTERYKELL